MRRATPFLVCLLLWAAPLVHAQNVGEYSMEILPDGSPRFTQVLRWAADPNVLYYETHAPERRRGGHNRDSAHRAGDEGQPPAGGIQVPDRHLQPLEAAGGRAAVAGLHRDTRGNPACRKRDAQGVVLEGLEPVLKISGTELVPGATVVLKPEDGSASPVTGTEQERDGTSEMSVSFPADSFSPGEYSLEVTDPGGLSCAISNVILVRHKLPVPEGLDPAGSTFGPSDLRASRKIQFSWDAVPEATAYQFDLYEGDNTEPLIRRDASGGHRLFPGRSVVARSRRLSLDGRAARSRRSGECASLGGTC